MLPIEKIKKRNVYIYIRSKRGMVRDFTGATRVLNESKGVKQPSVALTRTTMAAPKALWDAS